MRRVELETMKKKRARSIQNAIVLASATVAGVLSVTAQSTHAGVSTWSGNTDGLWSKTANWSALPQSGDGLTFTSATGAGGTTLTDDLMTPGTYNVANITFNSGAAAFTINPAGGTNGFTLTGNVQNNSTSLQTINDNIVMTATRTFTMTALGGNITLGGNISGTGGGITTAGTGTLTLSGVNSYTGSTTINGTSVVNINSTTAFGTSGVTFNSGATIDNTSGSAIALVNNNAITTGGTLVFSTAAGTNANSIDFGTGNWSFGGDRTFTMNGTGNLTVGTVVKTTNGNNTLTVNGASATLTFRGLQLSAIGDTTIRSQVFNGSGNLIISGNITDGSSAGGINKQGTGNLTIAGSNNTYTNGLIINGGTTNLNSATALGIGGNLTLSAGVFNNTSGAAIVMTTTNQTFLNGDVQFSTSTGTTANSLTFNGNATQNGGRTITLNGGGALVWTGPLVETGGSITNVFNNGTNTSATTSLSFGGWVLSPGTVGLTQTIIGSANVNFTGAISEVGVNSLGNVTFDGTGVYTLSGNNTHTGFTRLNNGGATLTLSGNNTAATGGVTLATGKLNLNSSGALGTGNFTIGGGTIDNTSGSAKVLTTNNLVIITNADFNFSTAAGTSNNNLTFGSGNVNLTTSRTINLNGAGVLAFGGPLINAADSARTLIVNKGSGTTSTSLLSFGGYVLTGPTSTAARTNTIQGSGNVAFTGAITNGTSAGSGFLYNGTGHMISSGNNTFTGLATLNNAAGMLTLSGNNSLMSGGVTLTAGKLNVNSATALGTGNFTFGGGTIDNTSGSAVTLTTTTNATISGDIFFSTSAGTINNSLNLGSGFGNITVDRNVTLNGAGVLTLGVLNNTTTSTRTIAVNNGSGTTATTALNLNGYILTATGRTTAEVNVFQGSGNVNILGNVTNGAAVGGLAYNGTGTLGLYSSGSTYTGNTTINAGGNLAIGGDSVVVSGNLVSGPLGTGLLILNGGTVIGTGGAHTIANPIVTNNDAAGTIGGTQDLTFAGNFNIAATGFQHYTTLNVNNTGLTTFSGGINITGMQFTLQGSGNISVNSAITGAGQFVTYAGTGKLSLSGTNTYSGGPTNVNGGVVEVTSTGSISNTTQVNIGGGEFRYNSATTLAKNVTLTSGKLSGNGTISGTVTSASSSAIISPGSSPGDLTIGALDATAGVRMKFELGNSDAAGVSDHLIITNANGGTGLFTGSTASGGLVMDIGAWGFGANGPQTGVTYTLVTFTSSTGLQDTDFSAVLGSGLTLDQTFGAGDGGGNNNFLLNSGSVQIQFSAVPEPTSLSIMGLGAAGLLSRRRRKRVGKTIA